MVVAQNESCACLTPPPKFPDMELLFRQTIAIIEADEFERLKSDAAAAAQATCNDGCVVPCCVGRVSTDFMSYCMFRSVYVILLDKSVYHSTATARPMTVL